ncbi:response regulator [Caulobacter segnis]|uniref:ATP-binding protein n=1 Tax=Caulobacter segnis TaxID=88688 RepID=UPI0024107459|nr:ATP-binding protein [Caulobacter segnis]MDG2522687.1 response regulator [Caulobacter segnis]
MLSVNSPLARRLLTIVAVLSILVTGAATMATFAFVQKDVAARETARLEEYVAERVKSEDRLFSDLVLLHRAASLSLRRRMEKMPQALIDAEFEKLFPLQADGTRRTAPELFDGNAWSYGLGGFIADGANVSPEERRLLVSGLQVVSHTGEAELERYDNFYMFTPETNRFIVFGPHRDDRLIYYRRDAPPTLDFRGEEMVELTLPRNNPERGMRCTKLRKLISDPTGQALTSACMTPIDVGGKHVASWGTTITLDSYLLRAAQDALPGGTNMIASADGELISYPGMSRDGVVNSNVLKKAQAEHRIADIIKEIRAQGQDVGVVRSKATGRVIAYGLMKEPGWYFMMSFSPTDILWSAVKSAAWILLFGMIGVVAQTLLLYRFTRTAVLDPLGRLAQAGWSDGGDTEYLEHRQDEIGVLARALSWQRAKNDDLLRSLEDRVAERTAELERANKAKSVFLANMSHELRTPLNGVIAIADQLAEERGQERRRELAGLVASSGRLLEQVLSDILDVSKIEAGQFSLTPAPFDLTCEVGAIAELHRASAEAKGLDYGWSVSPDAAGGYLGDAGRIAQVLSNLLANAVKFTETGGVTLTVDRTEDGSVLFCVRDTGVGFDEETRQRLFRRFEQADASITRRFGGTGLGLSICAALTDMMGGRISARSAADKGAVFEVALPLQPVGMEAQVPEPASVVVGGALAGLRVLVAEDHPTNRKVVQIVLEPFGIDLTVVDNGADAVEAFAQASFDVILMDMQMPVMDGLTATRLIREREARDGRPRTRIVMLTAAAMDEHVVQARRAGADLHVSKPVRPAELIEALSGVDVTQDQAASRSA